MIIEVHSKLLGFLLQGDTNPTIIVKGQVTRNRFPSNLHKLKSYISKPYIPNLEFHNCFFAVLIKLITKLIP